MSAVSTPKALLQAAIREKKAVVAVVGLGFVGLSEAVAVGEAGYQVVGLDIDDVLVEAINAGKSTNGHVQEETLKRLTLSESLRATNDFSILQRADIILLCLPTSIHDGEADLGPIRMAAEAIATTLDRPKLVILESTAPPKTLRNIVLMPLEKAGHEAGLDVFLATCPERIDLGNLRYDLSNTPRIVGGITSDCTDLASAFYSSFIEEIHSVSTPEIAEASKIFENVFRLVNISLVNELAIQCRALGMNPWEVLDAAATKPFGFMKHLPGAGVGGACIPMAPHYLLPLAREVDAPRGLMEAALNANSLMPNYVARQAAELAGGPGRHILVVGVTYKPGFADIRESPALPLIATLQEWGYRVSYWDPLTPTLTIEGESLYSVLWEDLPDDIDCAVVVTPHSGVNYSELCLRARKVFDTRNSLGHLGAENVIPL